MSGHALWNIARQACYQYVHHIKTERSFGDTLVLKNDILHDSQAVTWVKNNEIRYNNQMFDIKRSTTDGNTTTLIGHYDDIDYGLFKMLNKLLEKDEKSPMQESSSGWLSLTAVLPLHYSSETYNFHISDKQQFGDWQNKFHKNIVMPTLPHPPNHMAETS